MSRDYYTIGHSTRPLEEFVNILRQGGADLVVDVRTIPRSRTNPLYNRDALPDNLAPFEIGYEHVAELGGRRSKSADVPDDVNAFWQNRSFHNYADYALSDAFEAGLARLTRLGEARRCAIMCSEAVWWRCHRRIIADYLLHRRESVFHLMGPGHTQPASITPAAVARADGKLVYPPPPGLPL
jgi:uncharacterized protein (DUF488 family)